MTRVYTQAEIFTYLSANPLDVEVHVGDLEEMNNDDYIFFDYLNDELIPFDDEGLYKTRVQFTVCTKDYEDRKTLVSYIKEQFFGNWNYEHAEEHEYYLARMRCELIINE